MKRSYEFATSIGTATCELSGGASVLLPVIPGILKHPHPGELADLLRNEPVARKYTRLALEKAAWPVLRQFPRSWLLECLPGAQIRPGRLNAIHLLLS